MDPDAPKNRFAFGPVPSLVDDAPAPSRSRRRDPPPGERVRERRVLARLFRKAGAMLARSRARLGRRKNDDPPEGGTDPERDP